MSLYKLGISDKTMGAAQNSDPEVQKMMLESLQNNTSKDSGGGIMDIIRELFGFGNVEASDLGAIANIGSIANPNFRISNMYDQVYGPFNVNRRDSEIIVGADEKAKTIPILPMTSDEIIAGSIAPPDFNTDRFQSIFPTSGIMTQAPLGFDTSFRVANEPDEEQVEFLGERPNKFQEGLGKLFEFLQSFSPIATIGRGIESLRNKIDRRRAIRDDIVRDPQGTLNTIISPKIMNIQPTAQDTARGDRGTTTTSRRTAPQSGMQAERTRTRDLGSMRGGVGR